MKHLKKIYFWCAILGFVFLFNGRFLNDFFFADDYVWLENAKMSTSNLLHIFNLNIAHFFRPTVHLLMLLEYGLFELNPVGYHVTSLLLHALNAYLLYLVLRDSLQVKNKFILFITPVFWATHYMYIEALGWISAQTSLLLGTFVLLTLWAAGKEYYKLVIILFVLGLFTKEEAVFLFPLLVVYLYLFKRNKFPKKTVFLTGGIWFIYLIGQFLLQKSSPLVEGHLFAIDFSFLTRLAEKILVLFLNLQPTISFIISALFLLIFYFLHLYTTQPDHEKKEFLFSVCFIVLALLPSSFLNLDVSATRYFYIASIPTCLIIIGWLEQLTGNLKYGKKISILLLISLMIINFIAVRSAGFIFEDQGRYGMDFIQQMQGSISELENSTFNFVNFPYEEPAAKSLMKVYFDIPYDQVVFNQDKTSQLVTLEWN